ncbi:hypothetical protein DPEC_G00264880 [Dallia pectoralis]|uniref:Uncharacterized protein n=1 Tax=Dallia pectoralis TaxID=75939 RepID=A0ACC2FS92_DALPE|nr:hypothetical protein DPEC_G00264880 [Dallia pectoralis]
MHVSLWQQKSRPAVGKAVPSGECLRRFYSNVCVSNTAAERLERIRRKKVFKLKSMGADDVPKTSIVRTAQC